MILAGAHATPEAAARFLAEAAAIARLQHPQIVQIHHIGEAEGLPFFELELVPGGSLDQKLDGTPWPPQRAAFLAEQLGRGIAAAHALGIVHRDLKPANVLLGADEAPKITDFGLAKALDSESGLTRSEAIMGSPSYMAPEQAGGQAKAAGPAADVYSLGAILYELLVGRPPFRGATVLETLEQVKTAEPVPPSRLVPGLPHDAETIVLKCLQKEPARRYESAAALAEDLRRFLAAEPILARPVGAWERAVKWARRRPTAAATAATLLLAVASLLALGAWSYRSIGRARDLAESRRWEATAVAYRALLGETRALRLARTPGWRGTARENLRRLVAMETPQRDPSELRTEAVAGLAEPDLREVTRLDQGQPTLVAGHHLIYGLDFSPDGRAVIGADYSGHGFVWDWAGDRVTALPDDPTMAAAPPWSAQAALPAVRSHPGGGYLAATTGDRRVLLLGQRGHEPPVAALEGGGQPRGLAFDRRGRLLAVTWSDGRVGLYDAATGQLRRELGPSTLGEFYRPVALSPEGDRVAFAGPGFTVQVADVAGADTPRIVGRHTAQLRGLAFSPDGSRLASASEDRSAKVWDVGSGRELLTLQGHTSPLTSLDWSPDGEWIATGGDDLTLRLWDARTGRLAMTVPAGLVIPESVRFSPDGSHLAIAGWDVVVYELTGPAASRLPVHGMRTSAVAMHPAQPRFAVATDQHVSLRDLRTPGELWAQNAGQSAFRLIFSPDGRWLVTLSWRASGRTVQTWAVLLDAETGANHGALGIDSAIAAAFDPSGRWLAVADVSGTVVLRDVAANRAQWRREPARGPVSGLAFLDGGRQLLVGDCGGQVLVLDVESGRTIRRSVLPDGLFGLAVAPDGRLLATADSQEVIRIVALPDLKTIAALPDSSQAWSPLLNRMAFSPDGRRLAISVRSRRIAVWDARAARRLFDLPPLESPITDLAFAADGLRLAAATSEATITLWNLDAIARVLADTGLDRDGGEHGPARPGVAARRDRPLMRHPFTSGLGGTAALFRAGLLQYVLEARPDQAGPSLELAWARLMGPPVLRDPEAALPLARQAVELAPGDPLGRSTLGVAYARLGRWAEALAELHEAARARREGPTASDLFFQALCLRRLGRPGEARDRFEQALRARRAEDRTDPDRVAELNAIQAEADRVLRGENPAPPVAGVQDHQIAVALYSSMGRLTEAESHLSRMIALRPGDPEALRERGRLRERSGRPDEAAAEYAAALERMPMDLGLWTSRSALCNELTARPEVFGRVLARRPDDPLLRFALGLDLARRGDWSRAAAAFDRAGWFGAATEYTFERACLLLLADDAEGYRRLVARMIEGDGRTRGDEKSIGAVAYGLVARMIEGDGRTAEAARCFVLARTGGLAPRAGADPADLVRWGEQAARGDRSPWVLHALGLAYLRAGRPREAIRRLEESEATGTWTGRVVNWLALALAHRALGDDAEARRWSDRALVVLDHTPPAVFLEEGALTMPDWLEARVLRRELEATVPDQTFPANPFAR
jgi:WD40 repeat protein/tetratricopeptide (TPR) repeat protein